MEMYVQGVSTRRVKTITEELCGHEFSASAISELNVKMDEELRRFMQRRLEEPYPYIILDARYERVRENGVGQSRAVLITLGIGWDGRRHVLAVELAGRESVSSWKDHLVRLKERGLHGVQLESATITPDSNGRSWKHRKRQLGYRLCRGEQRR
jgi:transposase-like protein